MAHVGADVVMHLQKVAEPEHHWMEIVQNGVGVVFFSSGEKVKNLRE